MRGGSRRYPGYSESYGGYLLTEAVISRRLRKSERESMVTTHVHEASHVHEACSGRQRGSLLSSKVCREAGERKLTSGRKRTRGAHRVVLPITHFPNIFYFVSKQRCGSRTWPRSKKPKNVCSREHFCLCINKNTKLRPAESALVLASDGVDSRRLLNHG